ncbi:MAG TPA: sigma-54 dependent transcriptional regulator [Thermodesulfobacteriota bacterium]|nr:sigma-54-dependent Fis family transcriptional regulator [Deltaproteobacteria bacterium]HNR13349.1 sigma-54 dependent transcriptional regulator [Thermodesulfobacteriota bacterium]HQO77559.1 sigma-54 dependent transcriptional regulator [Thermodesulfobacteriota bacterium]
MSHSILVVDDEISIQKSLAGILRDEGYDVSLATNGLQAIRMVEEDPPDLIFLDIVMPGIDGIETLKRIKERHPEIYVIIISAYGTIETAVKAIKFGAFDLIEKPLSLDKVVLTAKHALDFLKLDQENRLLRQKVFHTLRIDGKSSAIRKLEDEIDRAAPTNASILITGENGAGKEVVAQLIHQKSRRSTKPYIEVNCAAIPEELIESELFGHEKGAFTGATSHKRGKFDLAHEGTLFLDEIGDMSPKTQAKILRILEEQKFERVGGAKTIEVDVRIIAATNKNLEEEIQKGTFREDLYFRINVIPLIVPPLRERKEDIPILANEFLRRFSEELNLEEKSISPEAMEVLVRHKWPGNVRELKNIIERLVIMTRGGIIKPEHIPPAISTDGSSILNPGNLFTVDTLKDAKDEFERQYIAFKLAQFGDNITKTAEAIGVERSHLYRKIKGLSIEQGKDPK